MLKLTPGVFFWTSTQRLLQFCLNSFLFICRESNPFIGRFALGLRQILTKMRQRSIIQLSLSYFLASQHMCLFLSKSSSTKRKIHSRSGCSISNIFHNFFNNLSSSLLNIFEVEFTNAFLLEHFSHCVAWLRDYLGLSIKLKKTTSVMVAWSKFLKMFNNNNNRRQFH